MGARIGHSENQSELDGLELMFKGMMQLRKSLTRNDPSQEAKASTYQDAQPILTDEGKKPKSAAQQWMNSAMHDSKERMLIKTLEKLMQSKMR